MTNPAEAANGQGEPGSEETAASVKPESPYPTYAKPGGQQVELHESWGLEQVLTLVERPVSS